MSYCEVVDEQALQIRVYVDPASGVSPSSPRNAIPQTWSTMANSEASQTSENAPLLTGPTTYGAHYPGFTKRQKERCKEAEPISHQTLSCSRCLEAIPRIETYREQYTRNCHKRSPSCGLLSSMTWRRRDVGSHFIEHYRTCE